uniref:Uncharacterized protein n=1 Tax=Aegilops tauschii subsp. strangulata TaxID=200361 RepID=A0A452XR55_AEGTS
MQSKGIKFMNPLKIGSEERAGEEWKICELIEKKELKQPENYISYQNCEGSSSILFMNYKATSIEDSESSMSESEINDDKNKGVSECMEKANLEDEINHWEKKLKHIEWEYSHSMTKDWPKIRERELFIIREIARLKKLKNDKKFATSSSTMEDKIIASAETKANAIINKNAIINNNNKDKNIVQEEEVISEEEQWDINNKLLLESYEEEEELIKEIWLEDERYDDSEQNSDFYNSLDDVGLHNLDNAMEVWK